MKVLHVSGSSSWGGNEQQLVDSVDDLMKLGVTSELFCFEGSVLEEYCKSNGIVCICTSKKKSYALGLVRLLKKKVKEKEIDVVHVHTSGAVTTCVVADLLFRLKVPIVFSKKGISKAKKGLSAFKYNYKNIKSIVCVSEAVKESFKQTIKPKNQYKLKVVYDGIRIERAENKSVVSLRKDYKIESDVSIVGNIANHTAAKDLKTYVKTINHLVNVLGLKNVFFIQIGEHSKYSEELFSLVEEFKLKDHVRFVGFVENAMDVLDQFDLYFMSSEREGLPITIYEAFYKRIPVVSTRAGGIPEAITNEENGFLNEVKDYEGLANNLKTLISDEEKKSRFAEKSFSILMNRFTSKQLANNMLSVYKEAVNEY